MDSQTGLKLIESCAQLAQALWTSLTSRARWRALWKAGDIVRQIVKLSSIACHRFSAECLKN